MLQNVKERRWEKDNNHITTRSYTHTISVIVVNKEMNLHHPTAHCRCNNQCQV